MKTLIGNAWILSLDDDIGDISSGWILVNGDRIEAIGSGKYPGEADRYIDAKGGIALPGFINLHCHVSMMPFRTLGDDCRDRLHRFLFPLENDAMTRKLVYQAARYGIAEMLLSGTTTFTDMYYFEDEVAKACEELGMHGFLGETVISQPTCDSDSPEKALRYARSFIEEYRDSPWVTPVVAPHATYTCSEEVLKQCRELSEEYNALLTLHVSETQAEADRYAAAGETPYTFLDRLGLINERLLAVHCIFTGQEDINLLKQKNASVAHCIGSNTKAGKGVAPVLAMHRAGISLGLGTDGASSGNTLSMFDQLRAFACAHKTANHDRGVFSAREIVTMAISGGAKALHLENETGSLTPGKRADIQIISTESVNMFPVYNPYSALVYSANSSDVDMVMTKGEIRVQNGRLCSADLSEIRSGLLQEMQPFITAAEKYKDMI